MKKNALMIVLLLCALMLTACGGGNIRHVMPTIGPSDLYDGSEIEEAMDIVLDHFQKEFDGCTLTRLEYDEAAVREELMGWAAQYNEGQAIVLLSDFDVAPFGASESLNANDTYRNWKWILTRSGAGEWTLRTWGYG